MSKAQAEEHFAKGLHALANGHTYLALVCFEHAVNLETNPSYYSYLGFCLAQARGQFREAINLCEEALEKDGENSAHYLNLGRILILSGQREKALQVLRRGLPHQKGEEIVRELNALGTRKPPVIPQLKRDHPLNKYCGIILKKLGRR